MPSEPDRAELKISIRKLDQDIARLADLLSANKRKWRAVIGIANGGVYPAGKIADSLKLEYREILITPVKP